MAYLVLKTNYLKELEMNLFRLMLVGVMAIAIGGSIFAAEQEKAAEQTEQKEMSLVPPHLEWMPDEIKLKIIKELIDTQSYFFKAVEDLRALMLTSKKFNEFINGFAISDLFPFITKKFFNNEKDKASDELIKLLDDSALSPFELRLLMEAGADLDKKCKIWDTTALIDAVLWKHTKMAEMLIRAGADLNQKTKFYGNTALTLAAASGHKEIAELLINAKADLNVQDYEGNTALMKAVENGHKEIVVMLIGNDAKLLIQNQDGYTALDLAKKHGHAEIVTMLENAAYTMTLIK